MAKLNHLSHHVSPRTHHEFTIKNHQEKPWFSQNPPAKTPLTTPGKNPLIYKPPHPDIHHNPQRHERKQHRRPSVTQQRQRNSRHWHQPDHHPHINGHLKDNHRHHTHDDETSRQIRSRLRILNQPHKDKKIKHQNPNRPHKTMLLAKRRKYKIRIRNRQKVPLRLGPLIRPFSPHST